MILFGDQGLVDLNLLKIEKDRLDDKNNRMEKENQSLYRTIERLKNDPVYIENVARQELGMIGKDEVIFKPGKKEMPQPVNRGISERSQKPEP
jgi:cell division protein FtsB